MKFVKMHGTGNDFVMVDNLEGKIKLSAKKVAQICNRHFGVGADGVILVESSEKGDCFMNYINADGSFAEMCGNGTRCTAYFMKAFKNFKGPVLNLETRSGIKKIDILENNLFTVNMGAPNFKQFEDFPKTSKTFHGHEFFFVSMGNPHAVGQFDSEQEASEFLDKFGSEMENDLEHFPNRINISPVWEKGKNHFGAKTHERGCGQTLACGTAMSGLFAVLTTIWNKVSLAQKTQIDVPGGSLFFEFNQNGEILMTGPSEIVFKGEINNFIN